MPAACAGAYAPALRRLMREPSCSISSSTSPFSFINWTRRLSSRWSIWMPSPRAREGAQRRDARRPDQAGAARGGLRAAGGGPRAEDLLGDLDGVQRGALAQLVAGAPEVEPVLVRGVAADAAHQDVVLALRVA